MAQFSWLYVNDEGKYFNVGLYHGPTSGHVVVHINSKVTIIDFHVLEDKTYTFFIEEELCEIRLNKKEDQFHYEFSLDKDADTPLNRQRKETERRHWLQTLAFVGALVLVVSTFVIWWQYRKRAQVQAQFTELLENAGSESVAKVVLVNQQDPVGYSFVANGRSYKAETDLPGLSLSFGLPLEQGDEFVVRYANRSPSINEIDFSRPTERQIERYQKRVLEKHAKLHPDLRSDQVACQVALALEIKGLAGLADFYFQDISAVDNKEHNKKTYLRLTRDLPFRKGVKERCY